MKYKIVFIDEEIDQHLEFQKYFKRISDHVSLVCLLPKAELDEMIEVIDEQHPDAIVCDYRLNEYREDIDYNVSYTGAALVEEYQRLHPKFPCFVLTSHDQEAVNTSQDVNVVYVKNVLNDAGIEDSARFSDRIFQQVDHYRKSIEEAQSELTALIEKREMGETDIYEEQKMLDLDTFLEQSLGSESALPKEMKKLSVMTTLDAMLAAADKIISKFEDK